jgi:integrase
MIMDTEPDMAPRHPTAQGSIRQRGVDSWQLRVYQGTDPATGRSRYATRTIRGSRRLAERSLRDLAVEVGHARVHAGTVGELLERYADPGPTVGRPWSSRRRRADRRGGHLKDIGRGATEPRCRASPRST